MKTVSHVDQMALLCASTRPYSWLFQALDEVGDVNVTVHETSSREHGRGGRRWAISFTALGYPAHVGKIQVNHKFEHSQFVPSAAWVGAHDAKYFL